MRLVICLMLLVSYAYLDKSFKPRTWDILGAEAETLGGSLGFAGKYTNAITQNMEITANSVKLKQKEINNIVWRECAQQNLEVGEHEFPVLRTPFYSRNIDR